MGDDPVRITREQYDKAALVAFETVMVGNEALLTDEALEAFATALGISIEPIVEHVWAARTWRDVRQWDVVRPPGQPEREATVTKLPNGLINHWHTDLASNPRWPAPMTHDSIPVTLQPLGQGEESAFTPPNGASPGLAVEIRVTRGELAAIEALGGWQNRVAINESGA